MEDRPGTAQVRGIGAAYRQVGIRKDKINLGIILRMIIIENPVGYCED